jgi:hypothetical protein
MELSFALSKAEANPRGETSPTLKAIHQKYLEWLRYFADRVMDELPVTTALAFHVESLHETLYPEWMPSDEERLKHSLACGWTLEAASRYVSFQRRARGHQRANEKFRAAAVRAADLQLQGTAFSVIVSATCACGRQNHTGSCRKKTERRLAFIRQMLRPVLVPIWDEKKAIRPKFQLGVDTFPN